MRTCLRALIVAALTVAFSCASASARAQATSVEGEVGVPATSESGLLTGVDFGLTAGAAPTAGSYAGTVVGGLSFGLDLGHQFDRSWGLFARLDLGTALVSNFAGSYLMLEYTPIHALSLAAGAGAEAGGTITTEAYGGVAFPVRISWNFVSEETWAKREGNDGWRLSLLLVGGDNVIDARASGFFRGSLTVGYAWR